MKCVICGKKIENEWECNNPWPVDQTPGAVCCSDCNSTKVIPARFAMCVNEHGVREWDDFEDHLAKVFKKVSGEVFDIDDVQHYRWWLCAKAHILHNMIRYGLEWGDAMDEYVQEEDAECDWSAATEGEW